MLNILEVGTVRLLLIGLLVCGIPNSARGETLAERMQKQAEYHFFRDEYELAEVFYVKSLEHRLNGPPTDELVGDIIDPLTTCCRKQGKYGDAEKYARVALKMCIDMHGADHWRVGSEYSTLSEIYIACKRYDDADAMLRKRLDIQRRTGAAACFTLKALGKVYLLKGNDVLAEQTFEEAINVAQKDIDEKGYAASTASVVEESLESLAAIAKAAGRTVDSQMLQKRLADARDRRAAAEKQQGNDSTKKTEMSGGVVNAARAEGGGAGEPTAKPVRMANDQQPAEQNPIEQVSLSPDGALVAARCGPGIQVWASATGERVASVPQSGAVEALHWLPDTQRFITLSADKKVRLWDAKKGEAIQSADGHDYKVYRHRCSRIALSRDGTLAATAGLDTTVIVWDTKTLKRISTVPETGHFVHAVAFSPTANLLATAGAKELNLWEPSSGASKGSLQGHSDSINDAAFSFDGTKIVTGGYDKTARVWDVASRKTIAVLNGHSAPIEDVCFSPNGRFVATASEDGSAAIWQSEGGELVAKWDVSDGDSRQVEQVAFSPDGTMVAAENEAGRVVVWDIKTKLKIKAFDYSRRFIHGRHANGFAFFPDCKRIVVVRSPADAVVWNLAE